MTQNRTIDDQKRAAAIKALDFVTPHMKLGLGTGSTAEHFVQALAARAKNGLDVTCTATSQRTEDLARSLGLKLADLDTLGTLDLTVDGADEADGDFRLIKGGGGALLREKIVASASRRMIVIADASKRVDVLGAFPLPVEIVSFAVQTIIGRIAAAAAATGCRGNLTRLRGGANPFRTDQGNLIVDIACDYIPDPDALASALSGIAGVVDHGLFVGLCDTLLLGHADGVEVLSRHARAA